MDKLDVYCPECARLLYKFDGKHTSNVNLRCKCGYYFRYIVKENKVVKIDRPMRNTSSGVRFW